MSIVGLVLLSVALRRGYSAEHLRTSEPGPRIVVPGTTTAHVVTDGAFSPGEWDGAFLQARNDFPLEGGRTRFSVGNAVGWATCPITESGFVRVSSNARVLPDARTPSEARALLTALRTKGAHRLWEDDVSVVDDPCGVFAATVGHRPITDAHLLTLAIRRGGALATFDRGITPLAGAHAESVVLIPG